MSTALDMFTLSPFDALAEYADWSPPTIKTPLASIGSGF